MSRAEKNARLSLGGEIFDVEVAQNIIEKAKGLAGRNRLSDRGGMLFVFPIEWIYPFTMRGVLLPLDIIWLDKSWKIVYISKNNKPGGGAFSVGVWPKARAKYVLEISGGLCDKLNIKTGDKVARIPSQ